MATLGRRRIGTTVLPLSGHASLRYSLPTSKVGARIWERLRHHHTSRRDWDLKRSDLHYHSWHCTHCYEKRCIADCRAHFDIATSRNYPNQPLIHPDDDMSDPSTSSDHAQAMVDGRPASAHEASSSTDADDASSSRHGRGLAGLLPHRHSNRDDGDHRNARHPSQESALGHVLAPALSIAGVHNPFAIGALREDGSRVKTYTYGKSDKANKKSEDGDSVRAGDPSSSIARTDDVNGKVLVSDAGDPHEGVTSVDSSDAVSVSSAASKSKGKRHRLRSFGRSLSPWRYHHSEREDGRPRRTGSWRSLSKLGRDSLDADREKDDSSSAVPSESDAESIRSIAPRNSAFDDAESEDDEMSNAAESDAESEKRGYSGGSRSSRAGGKRAETEGSQSDAERIKAAAQAGKGLDEDEEVDKDAVEETDEDEDDYIDFDNETLDNTLFNAGCIDLHDAWMQPSPSVRSPEDDMREHYYGPSDYDAAWKGAGPTGHDENDEGLRAPNVVIGQNYRKPSVELAGEGIDVLKLNDDLSGSAHILSPGRPDDEAKRDLDKDMKDANGESSSANAKPEAQGSPTTGTSDISQRLVASRPTFESNRCTITLVHGDYERIAAESKRRRRYIVASDGSEESSYAIEWTIGTVLRDGDEMLVVSVMETDTKLDNLRAGHHDKNARQEFQRIRQSMAVILARRAVAVLQRTRLAVKIACQAVHARNSRHMFIDMIDFFRPTMCVVGSRGLGSLKGVLLGSFSNYCVQKSPVPVMVARKRLKLPALPRGKGDVVSNVRRRHMRLDEATIDKDANVSEDAPLDEKDEKDKKQAEGEEGVKASTPQDHALDESKDSTVGPDSTDSSATTATGGTRESNVEAASSSNTASGDRSAAGIQQDAVQAAALQKEDKGKRDSQDVAAETQKEQEEQEQRGRDRRSRSPTK